MTEIIDFDKWKDGYNMYSELIREIKNKNYKIEDAGQASEKVLKHFNNDEIPVPIVSFAQKFGFKVFQQPMEDKMGGCIVVDPSWKKRFGTDKLIVVNSTHNSGHKRFTIAHELGHYLFDFENKQKPYYNAYFADDSDTDVERRVNQFAANLLMPENEFRREYNHLKEVAGYNRTIAELADFFGVSLKAVELRVEELDLVKGC